MSIYLSVSVCGLLYRIHRRTVQRIMSFLFCILHTLKINLRHISHLENKLSAFNCNHVFPIFYPSFAYSKWRQKEIGWTYDHYEKNSLVRIILSLHFVVSLTAIEKSKLLSLLF